METTLAKTIITRAALIELLECWARYRQGRIDGGLGWPKQVMLGKMLDGMPGTDCGRCKDAVTGASIGYVYIEGEGIAKVKVVCPVCNGSRRVKLNPTGKINPAMISGSGPRSTWNDDPMSQTIDWLICTELEEDQRAVILAEFTWDGNRNRKIARLHIRHSTFNDLLEAAMNRLVDELGRY